MSDTPVPSGLEIPAGILIGEHDPTARLPAPADDGVLEALGRAMLPALQRPPCFVSFSGGRDSSAILAVAVTAARRHGLADPVPATMRFPGAPQTDETAWQELVLAHLGLGEQLVIEIGEELDALGSIATGVLERRGLRWPANGYMHVPLLERASGGSLLTGVGGDELLDTRGSRLWQVVGRREPPGPRDLLRLALAMAPAPARVALWRRREAPPLAGLTPAGTKSVVGALARDAVAWPGRWDASLRHWRRTRAFAALRDAIPVLGDDHDVLAVNPFLDDRVLAEMAAAGGRSGFPGRTAGMRELFGGLLPDSVLARPDKAGFSVPLWGPAVREFASGWDGEGLDRRYVDVEALREHWLSEHPAFPTALMLHAAWLGASGAAQSSTASS